MTDTRQPPRSDRLGEIPACPADIGTPLFDTLPIDPGDFIVPEHYDCFYPC